MTTIDAKTAEKDPKVDTERAARQRSELLGNSAIFAVSASYVAISE